MVNMYLLFQYKLWCCCGYYCTEIPLMSFYNCSSCEMSSYQPNLSSNLIAYTVQINNLDDVFCWTFNVAFEIELHYVIVFRAVHMHQDFKQKSSLSNYTMPSLVNNLNIKKSSGFF